MFLCLDKTHKETVTQKTVDKKICLQKTLQSVLESAKATAPALIQSNLENVETEINVGNLPREAKREDF